MIKLVYLHLEIGSNENNGLWVKGLISQFVYKLVGLDNNGFYKRIELFNLLILFRIQKLNII